MIYIFFSDVARELFGHIPPIVKSLPPEKNQSFFPELGPESELTPLHLAAYQGNEGVLRMLINFPKVLPDVKTKLHVRVLLNKTYFLVA